MEATSRALEFFRTLQVDPEGSGYFEVAETTSGEHRVYTQSNYLLKITFNTLGQTALGSAIQVDPMESDNDPTRAGHLTGDRWCVLEDRTDLFYLKGQTQSVHTDELALLVIYWFEKGGFLDWLNRKTAKKIYSGLIPQYDSALGVLRMDAADLARGLYSIYKVALLGIAAKLVNDLQTSASVAQHLLQWQASSGGWITDKDRNLNPNGLANIETTCCCVLAIQ